MKIIILYITENGRRLADRLKNLMPDAGLMRYTSGILSGIWNKYEGFVFIMAAGIVVRGIGPMLKDKKTDPAVVVLDEQGRFAISLAGGHLAGANELAKKIASFLGGDAVITTASDVNGMKGLDIWAAENGLVVEDPRLLPEIGTRLVNNGGLRVYLDQGIDIPLPNEYLRVADPRYADVIVTNRQDVYAAEPCPTGACRVKGQLYLRPRNLIIGIGCNSGASMQEIEDAVLQAFKENNLSLLSLSSAASINIKAGEPGLKEFVKKYNLFFDTFTADELNRVEDAQKSETVFNATGAFGVAEPAAILSAGMGILLVHKQKRGNVTVAIAQKKINDSMS